MAGTPPSSRSDAGRELDYAEVVADVTVSAVASPGDLVVTLPARVYDGATTIMVEFFCARVDTGAALNSEVIGELFDDATNLFRCFDVRTEVAVVTFDTVFASIRLTPAAGSRTYNIKAFRVNSNATLRCAPSQPPLFLRTVIV